MTECPRCGSSDVMDDGRGWWFCNECPWGEHPQPGQVTPEPAPYTTAPGEQCRATYKTNPDWPGSEVVTCGRSGPHDGTYPYSMHRDAGCHWHWTDQSRGALTGATGEDTQ